MLSGICPRGNSNAPGSGNTGITSARSPGLLYSAFIGIAALRRQRSTRSRCRTRATLREQDRRQLLAPGDGRLVGRAPGLEEHHELLARAVVVPFAVALDDVEEMVDRLLAAALA